MSRAKMSDETINWLHDHPTERDALYAFYVLMATELAANDAKGNRPGWLNMTRKEAMGELHEHASKFEVASKGHEQKIGNDFYGEEYFAAFSKSADKVSEYAADTANCAMMALDVMGLLLDPSE